MTTELQLDLPMDAIADFCKRWKIREFAVFGSILRDDFRPDSDIDVMVTFDEDARYGLFALGRMKNELEDLSHRRVDLLTRRGVERSENLNRRERILRSARTIYAAR